MYHLPWILSLIPSLTPLPIRTRVREMIPFGRAAPGTGLDLRSTLVVRFARACVLNSDSTSALRSEFPLTVARMSALFMGYTGLDRTGIKMETKAVIPLKSFNHSPIACESEGFIEAIPSKSPCLKNKQAQQLLWPPQNPWA